jgi:2-dehydro-3-deoxyphosphogluconate aldolase/(4S)-4-hydroxy-2-oxoglutarate aldolase
MKAEEFVQFLGAEKCSAIIRTSNQQVAANAMEAAARGGFRILEFTLTIPGAFELIAEFAKKPDVVVGAGTVLSVEDARKAGKLGASFLVSPVVDEQLLRESRELGLALMPGTFTPTEMWNAHRFGAPLVKLFPAPAGGPGFVSAVLGPMPFLKIVPTNGIDEMNAADYLRAGSYAVGFVKSLFEPDDLREKNYNRIEERARQLRKLIAAL